MHQHVRRIATVGTAACLSLATAAAASAGSSPKWLINDNGTYTTERNAAIVSFSAKASGQGIANGTLDLYLGDTSLGPRQILGTNACILTISQDTHLAVFMSTNLGTSLNPDIAAIGLEYRDGGRTGDAALAVTWSAEELAGLDCATVAATSRDAIGSVPLTPISSGNIAVK